MSPGLARAQSTTAKIAVANPSKIFDEIQEKKDFVAKMKTELDAFKTEENTRAQKLKDQQTQRDMFKVDSPQFADADQKLLDMSMEFEVYVHTYQATLERRRKKQIISLLRQDHRRRRQGRGAEEAGSGGGRHQAGARRRRGTQDFEQMTENQLLSMLGAAQRSFQLRPHRHRPPT